MYLIQVTLPKYLKRSKTLRNDLQTLAQFYDKSHNLRDVPFIQVLYTRDKFIYLHTTFYIISFMPSSIYNGIRT